MPNTTGREPPRNGRRPEERRSARQGEPHRRTVPDFSKQAHARAEKRRRHHRHVLIAFYVFLFLFVLGAGAALSLTVLFNITDVSVEGTSRRYSAEQIVEASGISPGDNLFRIRTGDAAEKVRQKLPYLGTVHVSRKLPSKVLITVAEDKIWGAVVANGKYVVMGESGRALENVSSPPSGCTVLRGLSVKSAKIGSEVQFAGTEQLTLCREVMSAVQKSRMAKVTAVDFLQTSKILLTYDGRVTVNLGLPSDLDYKLKFADKLLKENIKASEKGTLDLSTVSDTNRAYFDPAYGSSSLPPASSAKK